MSKARGVIRALGAQGEPDGAAMQAALLETDGIAIAAFGETAREALPPASRADVAEQVETASARALSRLPLADIIGFDGPVLMHDPRTGRLEQAGDGAILSAVLDAPVVWDMRSSDMALGGQGAPIEAFFHHACARWAGQAGPVAFLGLGARAVLTWADPRRPAPEDPAACQAFDTGPGLGRFLADQAAGGRVKAPRIAALMSDGHFLRMPPRWAGPGAFAGFERDLATLPPADAAATARAALAACAARGLEHSPHPPETLFLHGPGRADPALLAALADALPCPCAPVEAIGLDGDALGAQAIAWLAVRIARGLPTTGPGTTGVAAAVSGGQISRPATAS